MRCSCVLQSRLQKLQREVRVYPTVSFLSGAARACWSPPKTTLHRRSGARNSVTVLRETQPAAPVCWVNSRGAPIEDGSLWGNADGGKRFRFQSSVPRLSVHSRAPGSQGRSGQLQFEKERVPCREALEPLAALLGVSIASGGPHARAMSQYEAWFTKSTACVQQRAIDVLTGRRAAANP